MKTISISLDDGEAERLQSVANRRETTVESLFIDFVSRLAAREDVGIHGEDAAETLARTFRTLSRPMNGKGYRTRDELYER